MKTVLFTIGALLAFAANSVICRLALAGHWIDAGSFTTIRLVSGAAVLHVICKVACKSDEAAGRGQWRAALLLFLYALTFSFAYLHLSAGTGALLLFGSVQLTMIIASLILGDRLSILQWFGISLAGLGFFCLVAPGITAPPVSAVILMTVAGVAWGFYSMSGRKAASALSTTAGNFARTLPFLLLLFPLFLRNHQLSTRGLWLAVISGTVTSGLGYTIWYLALRGLSGTQAAVVQLFVPVLAALAGVLFLAEIFSIRLIGSAVLILGGIALVIMERGKLKLISTVKRT
jgi:drug/metabolite transporter (DMT)-like permease